MQKIEDSVKPDEPSKLCKNAWQVDKTTTQNQISESVVLVTCEWRLNLKFSAKFSNPGGAGLWFCEFFSDNMALLYTLRYDWFMDTMVSGPSTSC